MSKLVAEINGVRGQAAALAGSATAPADVKSAAAQLNAKADALRKEIVATKEGGAITGEERLREHADDVYGAINSVEDRPTNYQMARVDALDRELKDVEAEWAAFQSGDLATFNAKLKAASLPPVSDRGGGARQGSGPRRTDLGTGSRTRRNALLRRLGRASGDGREGLILFGP